MRTYKSLDAAFHGELAHVLENGEPVSPRGLPTLEVTDAVFRIERPRARLIISPSRRWSVFYAIGEFLWHLSASNDLSFISYYSSTWNEFSDDARSLTGSCYGRRIFSADNKQSLWEKIAHLLRRDPDTRQAVITLFDARTDLDSDSRDVPCSCVLQFLLRNNALNMSTYMRSNDLMLGFGYDVFFFTLLQDMLATELDTTIGWYQHAVGSLHLYDKDRSRAQQIVAESSSDYALEMDRMTALGAIPSVLAYERQLREGSIASIPMHFETPRYWTQMLEVLLLLKLRRSRDKAGAAVVTDRLARSPYAALLPRDSGPNR